MQIGSYSMTRYLCVISNFSWQFGPRPRRLGALLWTLPYRIFPSVNSLDALMRNIGLPADAVNSSRLALWGNGLV